MTIVVLYFCSLTCLTGDSRRDKVIAFGAEGLGFESSHHRSTCPLGRPPFAVAPSKKIEVNFRFIVKKKQKDPKISHKISNTDF